MSRSFFRGLLYFGLACFLGLVGLTTAPAWGQQGTVGTVSVIVTDQSGGVVSGAALQLEDISTNHVRKADTPASGTYVFVGLPIGTYKLTVGKTGFNTEIRDSVLVHAAQVTDVAVSLKVGVATETVEVHESATPLLDVTSNTIATTIDMKQIEDLPLVGRDLSQLAQLAPGYTASTSDGGGTWNGLPSVAQGNNVDGIISSTSRMKFSGDTAPQVSVRIENIQEMVVQTGQMDLNQGFGQSAMQSTFITRRGSNAFHGRVYEDFRNSYLNANSWTNDAAGLKKNPLILNNFGGSLGGPILKDKLFFFGSFSTSRQPGGYTATGNVLTPLAQQGIFIDSAGNQTNLFTQVAQPNGLPTTIAGPIADGQSKINSSLSSGAITSSGDPNYNNINWFVSNPTIVYYPAVRVDYDVNPNLRIDFAWNRTKETQPGAENPPFPGSGFSSLAGGDHFDFYTNSLGVDWTITPTIINQFRGGFFYNDEAFAEGGNTGYLDPTKPVYTWAYPNNGSPNVYTLPSGQYYPLFSLGDNVTWQHGSHSISFGVSWWREQDHYYNPPDGIYNYSLGLVQGDPAFNAFESYFANANSSDRSNAENLYATLVGRVSSVTPTGSGFPYLRGTGQYATSVGAYNLDELMKAWGIYGQDSWRITPNFTLNFGLRWDFTGDNYDLTSAYQSADLSSIWGPSGVNNLFMPGNLPGNMNPQYVAKSHQYNPFNVTPQPSIGIAWNPKSSSTGGFWSNLLGSNTVIRSGFQMRYYTEPQQYFWNNATNHGFGYFQYFSLNAANGGGAGTFAPGSLTLGVNGVGSDPNALPPLLKTPPSYNAVVPMSDATWNYYWGASGMDPNIHEPYMMEWNLGIQRQIGSGNVLEVRYIGHHSVHEWIQVDPNEVNIFENGFLTQFKQAQANLGINAANNYDGAKDSSGNLLPGHFYPTFANLGFSGEAPLPIFDTAFAGESAGPTGQPFVDYGSGSFINLLNQGAAGQFGTELAYPFGTVPYICNLVGASLSPCNSYSYANTAGPYYPLNFFQANPLGASYPNVTQSLLVNGGYGNYHALQVDFRQKQWHGMQFDANYTWSHTLGLEPNNQWLGTVTEFSLRNLRQSYGPTIFDIRQAAHLSGTYDLPFGAGKSYLNQSGIVDKIVGGWNVGTILTYQTGSPFRLFGGYNTVNDYGDGGLDLTGVSVSQLQSAIGIHHVPCSQGPPVQCHTYSLGLDPKYLADPKNGGHIDPSLVSQNTNPGTFGANPFLYGPHFFNDDIAITKIVPITERIRFTFQSEFLNAFNHPNWTIHDYAPYDTVTSNSFAHASVLTTNRVQARQIEFRANIEF
ncbi:MAG TPA: carboxypeptidase regulatory-like domain-containing protein [Candidatus Acidoferrales bacterium]|nr:carboxypeptidase regulatory-like domain-containing protein [Candidatus Acidoferrales bacterium]